MHIYKFKAFEFTRHILRFYELNVSTFKAYFSVLYQSSINVMF